MRQKPNTQETKTGTSSAKGTAILANPDAPQWQTAWECMMQDMKGKSEAPLDHLGRTPNERSRYRPTVNELLGHTDDPAPFDEITEDNMPVPRGTIDKNDNTPERKVHVIRDQSPELPELHLRVCVLGPPEDTRGFAKMFARAYCEGTNNLNDCDLAVFTGGPDVDPAYYGEKPHETFCGNEERDYQDINAYMTCYDAGIPMLGVCRGAQFGAVMAGYKLAQHIDNHVGDHHMYVTPDKMLIEKVSSVHHQCVIPGEGMEVIGRAFKSSGRWLDPERRQFRNNPRDGYNWDVEAFFIRDTCFLGVQGHPEYGGYHSFMAWTLRQINEYVILNPDVDWVGDRRRLKPEFIKERDAIKKAPRERKQIITIPSEAAIGDK